MLNRKRIGLLAGFAVVSALAPADKSKAATILYSTGFEPASNAVAAGYPKDSFKSGTNLANPNANNAPVMPGSGAAAYDQAANVSDPSSPNASIGVYSGSAGSTNKQFAYIAAVDEDADAISTFSPTAANLPSVSPGSSTIDVVFQLNSAPGYSGDPFFGVEALDASGNHLAGVGEDGTTGSVITDDPVAGQQALNYTAASATPGTFNAFELQFNYATQKYTVYMGPASGGAFTPAEIIDSGSFSATTFGTFQLESFSLDGSPTADATGFGEFDNITVSEVAAVPEPATFALFTAGGIVSLLRRRRTV